MEPRVTIVAATYLININKGVKRPIIVSTTAAKR
jgi:hypothetical protein